MNDDKKTTQPELKIVPKTSSPSDNEDSKKIIQMPRTKALVLLIEDETLITMMYSKKLEVDGFDCIVAMNGDDGIKMAKEKLPDLILCDVMMPEKDGLTTITEIKAESSTKDIPIIMLSNLADQKYVDQALEVGAVSYLIKSKILPADVVTKVKEVLAASGKVSLLTKAA